MKVFGVLLLVFLNLFDSQAQTVNPEFKFYLAFEDATAQRDTVWFEIYESLSNDSLNSIFESYITTIDSLEFNTFFGVYYPPISNFTWKSEPHSVVTQTVWTSECRMINGVYPIKMYWDKQIMVNHSLSFNIPSVWISNDHTGINHKYDFLSENNLVFSKIVDHGEYLELLDSNHFPMTIGVDKGWPLSTEMKQKEIRSGDLLVYPNPANNIITIESMNLDLNSKIQIRSIDGKILNSESLCSSKREVNVQHLPSGAFFLVVKTPNKIFYEKIIKN